MSLDLVIRNGTIVDGLGGDPYVGDVAVSGGVIAVQHRRSRIRCTAVPQPKLSSRAGKGAKAGRSGPIMLCS